MGDGSPSLSQAASSLPVPRAGMHVWWSPQKVVKGTGRGGRELGWNPVVPDAKACVLDACLLIPLFVCHVIWGRTLHLPFVNLSYGCPYCQPVIWLTIKLNLEPSSCQNAILNTGNIAIGEIDQGFQFYAQVQIGLRLPLNFKL